MADERVVIDLDRCVGCGLCMTTCPTDALFLVRKREVAFYVPPQKPLETYIRIARVRGKL